MSGNNAHLAFLTSSIPSAQPGWAAACKRSGFHSGSGYLVHDLIAKGLAELGHNVFYLVPHEAGQRAASGITFVSEPVREADVLHTILGFR